jgi:hypothetical protein
MAKVKDPSKWSEISYIRCELDKQLKADLAEWLKKKHDWLAYIEAEVGNGLRFGVHVDEYNRCVEARLTLLSQSIGINTQVLQGRGPDVMAAIQSLFFKHLIVLEKNWEELDRNADGRYADWG